MRNAAAMVLAKFLSESGCVFENTGSISPSPANTVALLGLKFGYVTGVVEI